MITSTITTPAPAITTSHSVRHHIHDLDAKHGVIWEQTALDHLADDYTGLSDNDVELDYTEKLTFAL